MSGGLTIGETVEHRGQSYVLLRLDPYDRKDGSPSAVAIWRASCAVCGAEFEATTSPQRDKFRPARTCPDHRGKLYGGRLAWRHRVAETEPAPLEPGWRPHAPLAAYEGHPK